MRVAFHAPMKPPDHPVPSGDRRMARAFAALLESLGHEVEPVGRFRSYDRDGDAARQRRLAALGGRLAARAVRRYGERPLGERPGMWFTYHLYHKAPDWLGPKVSRALGIPYVVAEASIARRQADGLWADGHAASRRAIAEADLVLAMTEKDARGLAEAVRFAGRLLLFPPFLDTQPFVAASRDRAGARSRIAAAWGLDERRPWLLAVAMMRADAKLLSYRLLAEALARVADRGWQLLLVGDGEARAEVAALFAPFGQDRARLIGTMPAEALGGIYAAADLCVWPACSEAYGMALLEAQAAALPVVAGGEGGVPEIVVHGRSGLVVAPRDPAAFAAAVESLLDDPDRRRVMGEAAQGVTVERHDETVARRRLAEALGRIGVGHGAPRRRACASA
ncbi:MAG TPA: glycosyltransferase family 4 protein [Geminicoccaceae bacterium]|nr:glycosyltransferase family 4 protein [Geminicoccaceae bacterium]